MRQTAHKDVADERDEQQYGETGAQIDQPAQDRIGDAAFSQVVHALSPFFSTKFRMLLMIMMKQNSTRAMENSACFCNPLA